ncbi:MAG: F0F1 ATP synthase subunit B' [Pseudomonadota bacterium]
MMVVQARSILLAGIAAIAAWAPSLAFAAAEGGSSLPQLDPSKFATQLFWLTVMLVVFFFILQKNALPKIEDALETRRRKVDDDLDKASAHREEAEAAMAAYEKALADAAEQAKAIHRQVAQEIAESASQRRGTLAAKLAEDTKAAEARISAAKEPALANLQDVAIEAVQDVAAKLAGLTVSNADAKAAVAASLKEKA